jgi:hypothetical protein
MSTDTMRLIVHHFNTERSLLIPSDLELHALRTTLTCHHMQIRLFFRDKWHVIETEEQWKTALLTGRGTNILVKIEPKKHRRVLSVDIQLRESRCKARLITPTRPLVTQHQIDIDNFELSPPIRKEISFNDLFGLMLASHMESND